MIERVIGVDIDPASIGAGAALNVDINVSGLNLGQAVMAFPPTTLEAGLVPIAVEVVDSGAGALRIRQRIYNPTAGAIDGVSRRWSFALLREGAW